MQVQNFECQIAQSQMARYLAGEAFSPEAVKQLNEHIAGCTSCKASLSQRRASLQDQLSRPVKPSAPMKAVVEQTRVEVRKAGNPQTASTPAPAAEVVVSVDQETPQKVNV